MLVAERNNIADALTMAGMSVYNDDSTGRRIAWARKNVDWVDASGEHRIGMTGHELGRRLVTQGTVTGVRNVYVSQLENNHASPSLPMLRKIAEVTGVTVGFLLMEVDHPYPVKGKEREPEPVYFSPEADVIAKLVDDAPPEDRARILAVVRTLADSGATTHQAPAMPRHNVFAQRLIAGEHLSQDSGKVRA
jgi:transcriptional regulator with XRE-family HTH domain